MILTSRLFIYYQILTDNVLNDTIDYTVRVFRGSTYSTFNSAIARGYIQMEAGENQTIAFEIELLSNASGTLDVILFIDPLYYAFVVQNNNNTLTTITVN
jgi:hypothetical protein